MNYDFKSRAALIALALKVPADSERVLIAALKNAYLAGQLQAVQESNNAMKELLNEH